MGARLDVPTQPSGEGVRSGASNPLVDSQLDILRRICDRGLIYGVEHEHTHVVDLFQHMKDEVQRLRNMLGG